jgi:hypothetical protein
MDANLPSQATRRTANAFTTLRRLAALRVGARGTRVRDGDRQRHRAAQRPRRCHVRAGPRHPRPARSHARRLDQLARRDHANVGMLIDEARIPITEEVKGACEILGLDPLHVANEGKLVAIVPAEHADEILAAMRAHPLGRDAFLIGEVTANHPGYVLMKTRIGGSRVVDMLAGEQLPRIC